MRKTIQSICFPTIIFTCLTVTGQSSLPPMRLTGINGISIPLKNIITTDSINVIIFWATWCVPCINEMDAIQEKLNGIRGNQFIAISIDEARTVKRVKPMVKTKAWDFDFYLDESNEVKRAFNVSNIPFLLVISKGKIVYQHTGYVPGDEEILFEIIKHLTPGN